MIELSRHLEVLLLNNDCVAVPDFGGFVAHYVSARVDEADGMFLPPMRTIGFNPHLKMNDSLLAQSYVEAYDISYPEALRMIEQEVEEIKRQVLHEGSFRLEGIGVLTYNDEGSYNFEPQASGLLTPSLYGLSSFEFDSLKPIAAVSVAAPAAEIEDIIETEEPIQQPLIELFEDDDAEDHAVQIKMSWLRNTVAIAAAIALFFFLTTPISNSNLGSQTMSTLQNGFFQNLMPKDTNMTAATPVAKPEPVAEVKQETKEKADTLQPAVTPIDEKPYCLVLASQVKQANAEEFVRTLQNKGYKDTEIYVHNNVVRVVYGHFKSANAAYNELFNLRFAEYCFEDAWVYKRDAEG